MGVETYAEKRCWVYVARFCSLGSVPGRACRCWLCCSRYFVVVLVMGEIASVLPLFVICFVC